LKKYLQEKLNSPLKELDAACDIPSKIYDIPCVREGSTPDSIIRNGGFLHPELFITKHHVLLALKNILPDIKRPEWIRVGMAIHDGLGAEGFQVWNEWSSKGSEYKGEKDLIKDWIGFKKGEVTLGTLFHMAKYHPGETLVSLNSLIQSVDSTSSLSDQILNFLKKWVIRTDLKK
jgi:hypothetical protein